MGVVLWYGTLEGLVTGFWLLFCWKIDWTFAPSDTPLCTFLIKNFQPADSPKDAGVALQPNPKDGGDAPKRINDIEKADPPKNGEINLDDMNKGNEADNAKPTEYTKER